MFASMFHDAIYQTRICLTRYQRLVILKVISLKSHLWSVLLCHFQSNCDSLWCHAACMDLLCFHQCFMMWFIKPEIAYRGISRYLSFWYWRSSLSRHINGLFCFVILRASVIPLDLQCCISVSWCDLSNQNLSNKVSKTSDVECHHS